MRPEDLGIKGFTPEPAPEPAQPRRAHPASAVALAAEDARVKVHALLETAEVIERQHTALRAALDLSRGTVTRLSAELFHVTAALEEARRHRTILFVLGLLLVAVILARS
jgi:hypothetical protein